MSLFNKKENKTCSCSCNNNGNENINVKNINTCCGETQNGICCVKVLGSGCRSSHALLENAKEAVSAMNLSVEVEYVTDMQKIMEYGVMSIPALVINEKPVSTGKVLKAAEIEKLLSQFIS